MIGESIGQYRIIEKLGEGGMGVVYRAEQQHPKRMVALKVIRGGRYVDEHTLRMFEREVQSLALLKHPSIAAIYESGRTEEGQHFFTMELVQGETLTEWLARRSVNGVTPAEVRLRLDLFRKICDAVAFAHQRGVIHRDLKPSNILVVEPEEDETGSSGDHLPEVKILDFGLARITESDVAVASKVTEVGTVLGTLQYMSPEQVRGIPEEIDIRTDVYALGIILFEILAGTPPYDVKDVALHEAARFVLEAPTPPISKVWSGSRRPDRDLEIVIQKALEKDPTRRYQTAGALSEDLERYLADQPIQARPPSAVYQLRKMVRRHRLAFSFTAILLMLIIGFAITVTIQANRIAREREEALVARDESVAVTGFLSNMLRSVSPQQEGIDVTVREMLDQASGQIEDEFSEQPRIEALLRDVIGITYFELGLYEAAETHLQQAVAIYNTALGAEDTLTLGSVYNLATVKRNQGRYAESESLLVPILEIERRVRGEEHPQTLATIRNLATTYDDQGRYAEAESLFTQTLDIQRHILGEEHPETLSTMHLLGILNRRLGRYAVAESLYVKALEGRRRVLGEEHPSTLSTMNNLAIVIGWALGRYAEAESLLVRTLESRLRVQGEEHPQTLSAMDNLGIVYRQLGKDAEAESLYVRSLEINRRVLGEEHPSTLRTMANLSSLYRDQRRYEEAETLNIEALEIQRRTLGEEHPETLVIMNNLGNIYRSQDRYNEAESIYDKTLKIQRRTLGEEHPNTLSSIHNLAIVYRNQGRYAEAESLHIETLESRRRTLGAEHPSTLSSISNLAIVYRNQGRYEEVASLIGEILDILRRNEGKEHPKTLSSMADLAGTYDDLGRYAEAESLYVETLEIQRRVLGEENSSTLISMNMLALVYRHQGRYAEAESLHVETLEIRRRVLGEEHSSTLSSMNNLAIVY